MLIYTHTITPRVEYIFKLLFKQLMGVEHTVTTDLLYFKERNGPKLVYSFQPIAGETFIAAHPLLFEDNIRPQQIDAFDYNRHKAFFRTGGDLNFDPFAAAFFLVTRYEEYLPSKRDQYNRFQAKESVAYKHQFLHQPVIDYWMQDLKNLLLQKYPLLTFQVPTFRATVSVDVDVAFAYKGRAFMRNALSTGKQFLALQFTNITARMKVLNGQAKDPFDTYDYIRDKLSCADADHIFFFLLNKKRTAFDRNISRDSTELIQLIKKVAGFSKVGIHPSYFSSQQPALITEEKALLELILQRPVTLSRQHYLRMSLPDTYIQLIQEGITHDYSMGYAEIPGFRAGTCSSFPFFNLLTNQATELVIHPITYMEGSYLEDMQMGPEESVGAIEQLIKTVKEVNGEFLCIWHNHTLSDQDIYKGWRKPFEETLRLIKGITT